MGLETTRGIEGAIFRKEEPTFIKMKGYEAKMS